MAVSALDNGKVDNGRDSSHRLSVPVGCRNDLVSPGRSVCLKLTELTKKEKSGSNLESLVSSDVLLYEVSIPRSCRRSRRFTVVMVEVVVGEGNLDEELW